MRIKQRVQAQAPAKNSYAPPRSVLPSRPFSEPRVSLSGKQRASDSETKSEHRKPQSFQFGDVRVRNRGSRFSSTGRSLPEILRRKMEAAFGTACSGVRVHEDTRASAIGALASRRA